MRPERFTVTVQTVRTVRATYRRPGGRPCGFLVTEGRRIIATVPARIIDLAEARAIATRFARGCPRKVDFTRVVWVGKGDRRPQWLGMVGRVPVVPTSIGRQGLRFRYVFHPSTGIRPRLSEPFYPTSNH